MKKIIGLIFLCLLVAGAMATSIDYLPTTTKDNKVSADSGGIKFETDNFTNCYMGICQPSAKVTNESGNIFELETNTIGYFGTGIKEIKKEYWGSFESCYTVYDSQENAVQTCKTFYDWLPFEKTIILKDKETIDLRFTYFAPITPNIKTDFWLNTKELNLKGIDPYFVDSTGNDWNSNNGFDFNWTKVTVDGNIMATGYVDYNILKSYPQSLDTNLRIFLKYDDGNATHFYNSGNTPCNFLIIGTDTNIAGKGLWDTNAIFYSDKNYSYCTSSGIRNLFYNKPITISGWVNPKKITSNVIPILGINYGATSLIYVGVSPSTGKFYPRIGHNNGGIVGTFPEVPINQWSYIAGVITPSPTYPTGTGNAKIYLNGILIFNGDFNMMYNEINDPLSVYQNYFGGAMGSFEYDSIKFWDRALTQQEIVADYNSWFNAQYKSKIFDSGYATTDWDGVTWANDINSEINNVRIRFRACDNNAFATARCAWSKYYNSTQKSINFCYDNTGFFDGNQYFQYELQFDQNSTKFSTFKNYAYVSDVNILYYLDSHPPVITVFNPSSATYSENFAITITATDNNAVRGFWLNFDNNGYEFYNSGANFTMTWIRDGSHTITAKAMDYYDLNSTEISRTYIIQRTINPKETVAWTSAKPFMQLVQILLVAALIINLLFYVTRAIASDDDEEKERMIKVTIVIIAVTISVFIIGLIIA